MKKRKQFIALLLTAVLVGSNAAFVRAASDASALLTGTDTEASAEDSNEEIAVMADSTGDPISLMKGEIKELTTDLNGTVTWTSADTAVATVENGTVTGVALGKTTVTASDGNNTETFEVSVNELQYFDTNIFDYKEATPNTVSGGVTYYENLEGAVYLKAEDLKNATSGWGEIAFGYCGACKSDGYDEPTGILPEMDDTRFVVTYETSFSMHADGSATVAVPEGTNYFSAVAAVNQCMTWDGPGMTFKVTVKGGEKDGQIYTYVVGVDNGYAFRSLPVDINVTGATELKLEISKKTEDPFDEGNGYDHGVWADAKFTADHVDQATRMGVKPIENDDAVGSINDFTYELDTNTAGGLYFTNGYDLGDYEIQGDQNYWTGSNGGVFPGIAKEALNGSAIEFNYVEPGLFTLTANSAKDVFSNVQFPFVVDPEGYYTFDSTKMDAAFNDGIGENGAKLNWYGTAANFDWVSQTGGDKTGFFPFNDTKGEDYYDDSLNYWFGMSMAVDFYMLNGGYMDTGKNEPITFDFSGDDDVWVYIDGKQVMDLGGIHDMASGSINFGEDTIKITPADGNTTIATISDILGSDWVNDDGIHSLQVFYLERGKGASNLKIKFNLPQKDQLVVEKVYDNTAAEGEDAEELLDKEFTFQVTQDDKPYAKAKYALFEHGAMIDKNRTTDANGQLTLKYGQRAVFSLEMPRADSHTYIIEELFEEEGFTSTWDTAKNNVQTDSGDGTRGPETLIGAKPVYQRTNVDVYRYTFHNYRNTVLRDDTVVIDYGKEIDVNVFENDEVYAARTINLSETTNTNGAFTGKGEIVAFTPNRFMNQVETANYNVTDVHGQKQSATVTVIPATTVYYEDDFPGVTFSGDWEMVESDSTSAGKVQDDGTVGSGNNYGYDSTYDGDLYYSGGSAHYIQAAANDVQASFTFTGTGFDIVSRTDNATGLIRVVVSDEQGNKVYSKMIDTVYRTEGEILYQIPVINYTELNYGTYTVTVYVAPSNTMTENCTFYLDALRIYNPLGFDNDTANKAYETDKEKDLYTKEIRNLLIEQGELSSFEEGFVYVDLEDCVGDLQQYINQGPNNEVYLKNMDAVCTTLTTEDGIAPSSVQVGAKAPNGASYMEVGLVNDLVYDEDSESDHIEFYAFSGAIEVGTATDMYYDLADMNWSYVDEEGKEVPVAWEDLELDWEAGVPVYIIGLGDNDESNDWTDDSEDMVIDKEIMSLTYLKTTGREVKCQVSNETLSLLSAVRAMYFEEEKADTLTIYSAESDKTAYSRMQTMKFAIVTSSDVTKLELKRDNLKQILLKTKKTDNGDGTITWNITACTPILKGNYTYNVYAYNSVGEKSEPAAVSVKVK